MGSTTDDTKRAMVRHTLATLAYRTTKAIENPPAAFDRFDAGSGVRTPVQILAHLSSCCAWGLAMARGETFPGGESDDWAIEVTRFYAALKDLDDYLSTETLAEGVTEEKLLQGPIADAMTHCGQLAMLRRLAGSPIHGENFFAADIAIGRLGPDQVRDAAPKG